MELHYDEVDIAMRVWDEVVGPMSTRAVEHYGPRPPREWFERLVHVIKADTLQSEDNAIVLTVRNVKAGFSYWIGKHIPGVAAGMTYRGGVQDESGKPIVVEIPKVPNYPTTVRVINPGFKYYEFSRTLLTDTILWVDDPTIDRAYAGVDE